LHLGYRRGTDGVSVLTWNEAQQLAVGCERPTITKPSKLTVRDAANVYFKMRAATAPHDRFTWARYIEPKLGDRSVGDLTTGDVEAWLSELMPATDDRERRRRAQATANRYFNVLRAILNSAFRKDPARVPTDAAWGRVRAFPSPSASTPARRSSR
jgi:hypothetical protein